MSVESQSAPTGGSQVRTDEAKNRFLSVYLGGLAAAGVGVCVATYMLDWGFWGWFGGVFLLVAGAGGLAGKAKSGGAGELACPACGGDVRVMNISMHRTMPCPHCNTYIEGAQVMSVVPHDRVADHPAFEAPLPESFHWPAGCAVCRAPVTHTKKVEGMSLGGSLALMAAPVAVAKVSSVQAPCCDRHEDGVGLYRQGNGNIVSFRSYDYWRQFCELNGVGPSGTVGGIPLGRGLPRRERDASVSGGHPVKKPITNMAASARARLLNRAKAEGRPFNELLQYYGMERFLYRLAQRTRLWPLSRMSRHPPFRPRGGARAR